jgi:hypothetical protein
METVTDKGIPRKGRGREKWPRISGSGKEFFTLLHPLQTDNAGRFGRAVLLAGRLLAR